MNKYTVTYTNPELAAETVEALYYHVNRSSGFTEFVGEQFPGKKEEFIPLLAVTREILSIRTH